MIENNKKYFFCGIGGAGMNPLAHLLSLDNNIVEGSDSCNQKTLENLKKNNVKCYLGHSSKNINNVDVFVYSTAISPDNVEMKFATDNGIKCLHRADILAQIVNDKRGITIAGTHGKTTTSALTAFLLEKGGLEPTAVIGGYVPDFKGYHRVGNGNWIVAESDESDGSFIKLKSEIGVVLNIDSDHLDHYKDLDEIILAFEKYVSQIKNDGTLVYNSDDKNVFNLISHLKIKKVGYSIEKKSDFFADNISINSLNSSFTVSENNISYDVELNLPGIFNVSNAMAAIASARLAGVSIENIKKGCREFNGIFRRFQFLGKFFNADIVDDYAHHPNEIKAIKNIVDKIDKRTVAVFQPHRFSRTKSLFFDFVDVLSTFDTLIITDVCAASEKNIDFSSKKLFHEIYKFNKNVVFVKKLDHIKKHLIKLVHQYDLILFMGAGTISKTAHDLVTHSSYNGKKSDCYEA